MYEGEGWKLIIYDLDKFDPRIGMLLICGTKSCDSTIVTLLGVVVGSNTGSSCSCGAGWTARAGLDSTLMVVPWKTEISVAVALPLGNGSFSLMMNCLRSGTAKKTPKNARPRAQTVSFQSGWRSIPDSNTLNKDVLDIGELTMETRLETAEDRKAQQCRWKRHHRNPASLKAELEVGHEDNRPYQEPRNCRPKSHLGQGSLCIPGHIVGQFGRDRHGSVDWAVDETTLLNTTVLDDKTSTASYTFTSLSWSSTIGTELTDLEISIWITSITGVSILTAEHPFVVPTFSSLSGCSNIRDSLQFILTNFRIRYCVSTETTISRFVFSSLSISGILLAELSIIFTHASYSDLNGWIEIVSICGTPITFSTSRSPSNVKLSTNWNLSGFCE
ncbi:hypothetical protein OGAPHI_003926 [Ogataea philodendri]|uniref:Uncharacterized protein n=1 Tax=Ogataea philodendri TaxID=1378263 RepID=A0A9P8P4Q0_9ASCO|nr:uncharacterized protein OGAPHI_003926 [Ogataea philodendri]KAH3665738.1 hypothetical protein OGAPHI_003926 [Ogataea philodendri]